MNPANFPDNKHRKQTEAKIRQTEWNKISPTEKLRALDRRPGASKKERARIIKHVGANTINKLVAGGVPTGQLNVIVAGVGVGKSIINKKG